MSGGRETHKLPLEAQGLIHPRNPTRRLSCWTAAERGIPAPCWQPTSPGMSSLRQSTPPPGTAKDFSMNGIGLGCIVSQSVERWPPPSLADRFVRLYVLISVRRSTH